MNKYKIVNKRTHSSEFHWHVAKKNDRIPGTYLIIAGFCTRQHARLFKKMIENGCLRVYVDGFGKNYSSNRFEQRRSLL